MSNPISLSDLGATISSDLEDCTPELRAAYERSAIGPEKWNCSPWGEETGGFWAIAVLERRVLWYNDIEEGFNVSPFSRWGEIGDYACNQDLLRIALPRLVGELGERMGAPQPIAPI